MGAPDEGTASAPHKSLADLIGRDLGTEIDAEKLRDTIIRHWRRVQTLAHLIHDEDMREAGRAEIREMYRSLVEGKKQ